MKVKAIIKYHDTLLKRDMNIGDEFEVETDERLKQLLGNNKKKIVCVEVIQETDTPTLEDNYATDKVAEDDSSTDTLPADEVVTDKVTKEAEDKKVKAKAKGKTKNAKK